MPRSNVVGGEDKRISALFSTISFVAISLSALGDLLELPETILLGDLDDDDLTCERPLFRLKICFFFPIIAVLPLSRIC